MKKLLYFSIMFITALKLNAQNDNNNLIKPITFNKNEFLDSEFRKNKLFENSYSNNNSFNTLYFNDLNLDSQQMNNHLNNLTLPKLPNVYDYSSNIYTMIPIRPQVWVSTFRTNSTLYGLGGMSKAGAMYNFQLNSNLTMSAGTTFSKYNVYNSFYNDISFNGNMNIKLTERINFNLFGNYAPLQSNDNNTVRMMNSAMFPTNYYGGSVEFKVNENWGVITGAKREFDVLTRKWITEPFIMPIFYSK